MSTSTIVKILLAVFLGAFLWFVIISIQTPQQQSTGPARQALREELVNRSVNVNVRVGNLIIEAQTAEEFRNGEVHYRDFKITQTTEVRTVNIIGKVARTRSRGTEVEFVEMEGNIRVESSDGLNLNTRTINYESAQKRIFSNDSVRFSINELSGRSDRFIYFTEDSLLDLQGAVRCKMNVEEDNEEKPAEPEKSEKKPANQRVNLYAEQVLYNQQAHSIAMLDNARIARAGSYILGDRIDAELTDDNAQFKEILVNAPTVKDVPEENQGSEETQANNPAEAVSEVSSIDEESTETNSSTGSLSHHAGGIKDLKAKILRLVFDTGDDNLLKRIEAREEAQLDISPTVAQILAGKTEIKKIRGQNIESVLGDDGKGIKNILINSSDEDEAEIEIKPYRRALRRVADVDEAENKPARTMRAERFNIVVDPETNEFNMINMNGNVEFKRGDLTLTSEFARYDTEKESIDINGNPVLRDNAKRVSGKRMKVSLDIGDLEADGPVETLFYPPDEKSTTPGIFAIGAEISETVISSGSLRFDYNNNILRYREGVRISQGDTVINCQGLDIDQKNEVLRAFGSVTAGLAFKREGEAEQATEDDPEEETADEGERQRRGRRNNAERAERNDTLLHLSGERLIIDKMRREVRVEQKAQSIQGGMTLAADTIRYELSETDTLLQSSAKGNVRVNIGGITIFGETAMLFMSEQLLLVEGRDVRYVDAANKMESNHSKLTYDLKDGSMRLDARADQLVKTRILN